MIGKLLINFKKTINYSRLWESMGDQGRLWESMGDQGRLWESMGDQGRLWESMGEQGRLWDIWETGENILLHVYSLLLLHFMIRLK